MSELARESRRLLRHFAELDELLDLCFMLDRSDGFHLDLVRRKGSRMVAHPSHPRQNAASLDLFGEASYDVQGIFVRIPVNFYVYHGGYSSIAVIFLQQSPCS